MSTRAEAETSPIPEGTSAASKRQVLLFLRMWAVAHLLHVLIYNDYALASPAALISVVAALGLLLRPADGRLFLVMALGQLADYLVESPFSPDHWALVALGNLAILATMVVRRSIDTESMTRALPALRVILLVGYGAAALAKWNFTFLDPIASCANALASVASYGQLPALTGSLLVTYGSLAAETAVFVFLLLPWTRWCGVMLGLCFHFLLSASPAIEVEDYTSTVFALFILFLHPETVSRMLDTITTWSSRSAIARDARRVPWLTVAAAFLVLGLGGHLSESLPGAIGYVGAQIYFLVIIASAALAVRQRRTNGTIGDLRLAHLPVVGLAIFWALNPYLGLRTTGVNSMFSNLRTEVAANHVFMPTVKLGSWQDDVVALTSSNDPVLQSGADHKLSVPLIALRRMATDSPDLVVTGILDGEEVEFGPGEGQERLAPLPTWQHKFILMRPVASDAHPFCSIS